MEFESFKDYIEHENEVYQKMAEDAIWDLKHNPLYNGAYTRFYSRNDYDYSDYGYQDDYDDNCCEYGDICENSFEKRHRGFHKFHHRLNEFSSGGSGGSGNSGNSGGSGGSGKPRDLTDAEKKQLETLCNTYNTCTQYLGLLRMEKLIETLNVQNKKYLHKLYQDEEMLKNSGINPDSIQAFKKKKEEKLTRVFAAVINSVKKIEDKTGREDLAIKLDKGKKKYVIVNKNKPNEVIKEGALKDAIGIGVAAGAVGALGGWTAGILTLVGALLFKFGKTFINFLKNKSNDGTPCKGNHLDDLYEVDRNKVDEKATDDEKAKMKVLWTKKIEANDIKIFRDPDPNCNFFKNVVCLTYKFGPKSIDELTNLCIKSRAGNKKS